MDSLDRRICLALFVLLSSLYFITSSGITSSNDGSHYALVRSMVDRGTFEIADFAHYAEGNDLAIRDERIYSDRPPGTALVAAPVYWLARMLPPGITELPSRHDSDNAQLAYLMMLPACVGAGAVVLVYRMARSYDLSRFATLTASLAFGLGTAHWKYSTVLFSHAPSALWVLCGMWLALRLGREESARWPLALALGAVLGLAVVTEYSNLPYAVILGLYVLVAPRLLPVRAVRLALGALLPMAFLAWYNTANFGSPLITSYRYAINYPWASSFTSTFDVPLIQGLRAMLWFGVDALGEDNQGLLLLSPVVIAAIAGIPAFFRKNWREALLVVGVFLGYLLLFSKHHSFSGFTFDGRYLVPFLGLLFIPAAFAVEQIYAVRERLTVQAILYFLLYGLLFLSIRNMMAHIAFSYNYHLDPGLVMRRSAHPENWAYILRSIFPNTENLPLQLIVEGVAIGAGWGIVVVWRRYCEWRSAAAPPV